MWGCELLRYGSCEPGLKYLWGCAEGRGWPLASAPGQPEDGVGARSFEFMHRVAKWLSAISANIGWTFPGPRSRLVFRLSSPCTLEIIQCGFCKGFLRVIEFLLVQKSMKSCTFKKKKKKGKNPVFWFCKPKRSICHNMKLFFFSLSDHLQSSKGAISQETNCHGCVPDQCLVYRGEISKLLWNSSTLFQPFHPRWPKTKQTKNSQTQISSTWAVPNVDL